jgi:hypothetical protein
VAGGLPVDANGNSMANGSFEVRLPSVGNATPLTLGATLVVIYRIPTGAGGPNVPLNAIVIYDGDYSQSNAQLTMTQPLQGFYDADANPVSRLTHIVGSGQSNKFQAVYLYNGSTAPNPPNPANQLPSLYGNKLPVFPGWYGTWDNPTWTFTSGTSPLPNDASSATTQVVPNPMNQGCVSWGAVIMSTTVKNSQGDGILDSWKKNQGYCDAGLNNGVCSVGDLKDPGWVDLTGAAPSQQDVFLQYDYMCSKVTGPGTGTNSCDVSTVNDSLTAVFAASGGNTTYTGTFSPTISAGTLVQIAGFTNPTNNGQFTVQSGGSGTQLIVNNPIGVAEASPGIATYANPVDQNYSFDPRLAIDAFDHSTAVDKVVSSFEDTTHHGKVVLHAIPGNAILESQSTCADTDRDPNTKSSTYPNGYLSCPFPNQPGAVGFREGLTYIKNQTISPQTGKLGCTPSQPYPDPTCIPVFQHGKKDSYHYALFSDGVGLPSWFLADLSISSVTQSGPTVTFTTASPHGLLPIPGDTVCSAANNYTGRVTVVFAITNPNLNGTFCATAVGKSGNQFSITVNGTAVLPNYTPKTDPNLAVANGLVTSMSGYSDVGGQNSVVSLGYGNWGPPNNPFADGNKWQVKAGTFMHELGHTLGLTHGGTFLNNYKPSANPPVIDYTLSYEANCKPNVQTSMSYMFQFDLLQTGSTNPDGSPKKVVDYSEDPSAPGLIPSLAEGTAAGPGVLDGLTYANTSWFQRSAGPLPSSHCDGTPTVTGEPAYSYTNQPRSAFSFSAGQDINFDGNATETMNPHNEWEGTPAGNGVGPSPGIDLRQVSALGTVSTTGAGGEAGGTKPFGGGGGTKPLGGGGGLTPFGGGGGAKPLGGGGGTKPFGGGGAIADITHNQATSYPRPAENLFIVQEEASPRVIDLGWFGPSLTPDGYNIYQSTDGGHTFTKIAGVSGSQTSYQAKVTCSLPSNPAGYFYQVKAVTNSIESSPTNTVPAAGEPPLTGCYTAPNVAVEANGVQGDIVAVKWTLTDDRYVTPGTAWAQAQPGNPVTNQAASTLIAVGPDPTHSCAAGGRTTLLLNGAAQSVNGTPAGTFANSSDQFTFTLDTDVLCAGSYTFELDLDSGQTFTSSSLQLSIDVGDQEPRIITTPALPAGTVGLALDNIDVIKEDGGTVPFTWSFTGLPTLPAPGVSFSPANPVNANQITLSGRTCVAGTYNINATVTDSKSNSGSQAFTLLVNRATTTTGVTSNANPSVFQQTVTFTVTVTPQYGCTPTGTVTLKDGGSPIASSALPPSGIATLMTSALSVGVHSITASYGGDGNFNGSNSGVYSQTVNKASTQIVFNSVSPSTVFVGQPVTISYTFSVMAPGAGSPIAPSGNIMVSASDGSSCMPAAVQGAGMCTLSPPPTAAASLTFTITYLGDGNFVGSGDNGNYTVYKLVFTTQPSNTGVGLTITPAVAVTAEDSSSHTFATFAGGITVAIGSGPGTLSGTLTQNASAGVATFNDLSINKIANGYTLTASPALGAVSSTSGAFNIDTFYVDGSGNFGTLDLASGTATQIGAGGTAPNSTGMDLTPGLLVYEYNTSSNQLIEIAPSTGAATTVGSAGSIPDQATAGALTNGSYFGIDVVTGQLYSIDLTSGVTTSIGGPNSDGVVLPAGCTLEASLTGSASALYYTIGYSGASCGSPVPDTLYQIDPTSGTTTTIGPVKISGTPANGFVGSTFVGSTLYGFTSASGEYSINTTTGAATSVTNTTVPIVGAGSSQ